MSDRESRLTQAAVARGSRISESALSEILAGRRPMGRKTIETLARYFHVDPGLFLARGDRVARSKGSGCRAAQQGSCSFPQGDGALPDRFRPPDLAKGRVQGQAAGRSQGHAEARGQGQAKGAKS